MGLLAANRGLGVFGLWRGGSLGCVTGRGEPSWQPIGVLPTIRVRAVERLATGLDLSAGRA